MSRCPNHWRGQHNFKPRYESRMPDLAPLANSGATSVKANMDHIYVRDVCTRCGETIERQGRPS
jgi:hypothetical protein